MVHDLLTDLNVASNLFVKNPGTGDNSTANIYLQTAEADIAADDVIGKINFQAPNEGTGTDAILVSAAIQAISEGDFSSSSNATSLNFMTGASEAATTKMTLSSGGNLTVTGDVTATGALSVKGGAVFNEDSADVDFRVESNGNANMLFVDGGNDTVGIGTTEGNIFGTAGTANELGVQSTGTNMGAIISVGATGTGFSGIDIGTTDLRRAGVYSLNGSHLAFYTNAGNSGDSLTERFRIASDGSLSTPTSGTSNFRAGVNAGNSIVSGANYNVLVGDNAGTALVSGGVANTAVGYNALAAENAHGTNTAIGYQTLQAQDAGANGYNAAVGYNAGASLQDGIQNTFVGANSGDGLTTADGNTALGYSSLSGVVTGGYNTALGWGAGQEITSGLN